MTRYEEVKQVIAHRFARQILDEVPVSSPQTVEALANDLCEFMAELYVLQVTDDELRAITDGPREDNHGPEENR